MRLDDWVGREEAREDTVTVAPLLALSALLDRDDPGGLDGHPLNIASGAGLRLAIARNALRPGSGSVTLTGEPDAATLEIHVRGRASSD